MTAGPIHPAHVTTEAPWNTTGIDWSRPCGCPDYDPLELVDIFDGSSRDRITVAELRRLDPDTAARYGYGPCDCACHRPRLAHCTTWNDHSPVCDRDGRYCGMSSRHDGPCEPHGTPR